MLRLGLLGFSDPAGLRLQDWVVRPLEGRPLWTCCDPHLADAWMVNGASVEVQDRDALVIQHPIGSDDRLQLNRAAVDRPLAFASPLPDGFASAEFFDADDEDGVRQRLLRFEAWLRPLRSQFALGAELLQRLGAFSGVVHVQRDGRLLAVVDFARWHADLLLPARALDLAMADWVPVKNASEGVPPSFMRLPLYRVMWTYAVRTARDVLPRRYRERTIYLRRVPQVPARWFAEDHMIIMRELLAEPSDFDNLQERTGMHPDVLAHHLSVLYHAGGLTTDAEIARRAEPVARRAMTLLRFDQKDDVPMLREAAQSQSPAPLPSFLREALHSPLRVSTFQELSN
jgi:DNA-binding transcriptional ArsR family regulator